MALPMGAQSVNHYKATLHSLFAYGVKVGAYVANPVSGIDSRKVMRAVPSILNPALLSACEGDYEMARLCRRGRVCGPAPRGDRAAAVGRM